MGSATKPINYVSEPVQGSPFLAIIDAGHGGKYPGNVCRGIKEKDDTIDMARRLAHNLRLLSKKAEMSGDQKIATVFSRTNDMTITVDARAIDAREIYNQWAKKYDRVGKACFISLHTNSATNPFAKGAEAFYAPLGLHTQSKQLATFMLSVCDEFGLAVRGVKRDTQANQGSLGVLRGTCHHMPAVLFELWFNSNSHDRNLMVTPAVRELYATLLALQVVKWFGITPRFDLLPVWKRDRIMEMYRRPVV